MVFQINEQTAKNPRISECGNCRLSLMDKSWAKQECHNMNTQVGSDHFQVSGCPSTEEAAIVGGSGCYWVFTRCLLHLPLGKQLPYLISDKNEVPYDLRVVLLWLIIYVGT